MAWLSKPAICARAIGVQTSKPSNSQGRPPCFVNRSALHSLSVIANEALRRCWRQECPRGICRVTAPVICACSCSLFRSACRSFGCQRRFQCSRRRTTTALKSRSVRAAMEGRPIVRRWRGLQRGPLVLHSCPSRPASNYTHCSRAFNPAKTAIVVPKECELHGQVKT